MRPTGSCVHMQALLVTLLALLGTGFDLQAGESKAGEFAGFTKIVRNHVTYEVNADGTHIETHDWALKVLSEQGLDEANTTSISYSDHLQRAEIVNAYTLKADGRRIDVPKANFQEETNTGKDHYSPMFSDSRTETVAFADVAVGDTVAITYRFTQKEPTFPGNFSFTRYFSKFYRNDDATIDLTAPASLPLRVYQRGVNGGELPSKDGRRRWRWSYKSDTVAKPEPRAVDPIDYGPLIVVSTFKDYGALAAAYEARAKDKAVADDKIRKLATDLTTDLHTQREQAKALYEWVATNIQYAGNDVGSGGVVPRKASLVLSNRMGDCKDHSTLLEAMLAVKGIDSTQVLVNAGSAYTLPPVADIEVFDHTINYIPALDLYVDSTSQSAPFGSLPLDDSDKPVIHTSNFIEPRHTPPTKYTDTAMVSSTVLTVHPDGSAEGSTTHEGKGFLGDSIRSALKYIEPGTDERIIKDGLQRSGYVGSGSMTGINENSKAGTVSYTSKFRFKDAINIPGPGALPIRSPVASGSGEPFFDGERTVNYSCYGYSRTYRYTIHLPHGIKVLAVPRNVELKSGDVSYRASYRFHSGTVDAEREIDQKRQANVCTPAQAGEMKSILPAILHDFRAQLVYR